MKKWLYSFGAVIGVLGLAAIVCALTGYAPDYKSIASVIGTVIGGGSTVALGLTFGGMGGAGAAPAPNGTRTVLPFREHTRQKAQPVGQLTYSLGGQQFIQIPKIGYLSSILLRFNGSITATNSGADTITYAKFGPWSVFRNIQLDLNSGKQILCNLSGYELFNLNAVRRKSARIDQNADADYYAAPTTGSAQNIRLTLEIPVALSDGVNFQVGMVNLQAPELQCNLTLGFASALTDIGSNISTLTGTVDVLYKYYEVPDPTQVQQPPVILHKILSQPYPVLSTGENRIEVPRGGDLLRVIQILECNGAKSDAYDNVQVWLNKTQKLYQVDRWAQKFWQRERYGFNLPTGVAVWDFQEAWDHPEESDLRDVIDTEAATTTEFVTTVTAGTTLGTNNNFIHTVREFLQIPV